MMKTTMNAVKKMTASVASFIIVGATAAKTVDCSVFDFCL